MSITARLARIRALQKVRADRTARTATVPADSLPSAEPTSSETLLEFIERVAPRHVPVPWHLLQLIELFERAMRERVYALVSMPPRHAKTTTVRRALAWAIKRYPDRLNGLAMHAEKSAQHQSRMIRKLVRSEGVALERDAQSVSMWLTPQEGGLFAAGVLGQWTGKGINGLLVCDDLIKGREAAESEVRRDAVWETFTDDILTRREPPGGSVVVVETRWHEDDPPGRIIEHEGVEDFPSFEVLNLPALRDPDTGLPSDDDDAIALWPERFPVEDLRQRRAILGPYGWSSLFQGNPVPRGGKLFRLEEPPRFDAPLPEHARTLILSVDGAGTEDRRRDFTVAGAIEFFGAGDELCCNILEVERWQLEPQDSAPKLLAFQERHLDGGAFRIENTRDGKQIAKALRKLSPELRIVLINPIGDKYIRAQPVAAAWNQGRVRLPRRGEWIAEFLREVLRFNGSGAGHDDQVDMLSQAWNVAANGTTQGGSAKVIGAPRDRPPRVEAGDDDAGADAGVRVTTASELARRGRWPSRRGW